MTPYGRRARLHSVNGHQDCAICHPMDDVSKARARREGREEIAEIQRLADDTGQRIAALAHHDVGPLVGPDDHSTALDDLPSDATLGELDPTGRNVADGHGVGEHPRAIDQVEPGAAEAEAATVSTDGDLHGGPRR